MTSPPETTWKRATSCDALTRIFPKGSVHIILVDSLDLQHAAPMAMELDGHFFLGLNHGGLSLIRPDLKPRQCVTLDLKNRLELNGCRVAPGGRRRSLA